MSWIAARSKTTKDRGAINDNHLRLSTQHHISDLQGGTNMTLPCLIILSLSLVLQGSESTPDNSQSTPDNSQSSESLRILSYNIHMWQIGVEELAHVIRSANADIVGLNEAWTASKNNKIAEKLGYNIVYGGQNPERQYPPQPHSINGFHMPQVLLTKHKIVEAKVFNSMAAKDNERFDSEVPIYRGGTLAVLETSKVNRLVVFVLHLHPWGDGQNKKMITMRLDEMKGIMKTLKPYRDMPILIIGDFNTRSHSETSGLWKVTRHLAANDFTDLFRSCHSDAKKKPGLTCGDGRIDYIFYNRYFEGLKCQVLTDGVFGSKGYQQSDHLAVFGIVKLKSSK